jgi:hypothetical protein
LNSRRVIPAQPGIQNDENGLPPLRECRNSVKAYFNSAHNKIADAVPSIVGSFVE